MVNHPNRSKQLMTTTAIDPDFVVTIHARVCASGNKYVLLHKGDYQEKIVSMHRDGYLTDIDDGWQVMLCDVRDLRSEIAKWFGIGWLSIAKKSIREFEKRYGLIPRRETAA